jgi:hypothetical protein
MGLPQLVGLPCVLCQRPIGDEREGGFCDRCGNPLHPTCLLVWSATTVPEGRCPTCGGDPRALIAVEVRTGRAKASGEPAPGALARHFPGGLLARVLLTVAQIAALLACVLALVGIPTGLDSLGQARRQGLPVTDGAEFLAVATGLLHAVLWVAVCVVFGRARVVVHMAAQQDAENRRLWEAIEALRIGAGAPGKQAPRRAGDTQDRQAETS